MADNEVNQPPSQPGIREDFNAAAQADPVPDRPGLGEASLNQSAPKDVAGQIPTGSQQAKIDVEAARRQQLRQEQNRRGTEEVQKGVEMTNNGPQRPIDVSREENGRLRAERDRAARDATPHPELTPFGTKSNDTNLNEAMRRLKEAEDKYQSHTLRREHMRTRIKSDFDNSR